ncbi:MAG TPA: hypothetical protein G4O13_03930 [Dehalococcoidia bacterium]|nr:hypothetical protein [Dehalococcoidia bacterium]
MAKDRNGNSIRDLAFRRVKAGERRLKRSPFRAYYNCVNCGHRWDEDYPKEAKVRESGREVILIRDVREGMAEGDTIKCPQCQRGWIQVIRRERLD